MRVVGLRVRFPRCSTLYNGTKQTNWETRNWKQTGCHLGQRGHLKEKKKKCRPHQHLYVVLETVVLTYCWRSGFLYLYDFLSSGALKRCGNTPRAGRFFPAVTGFSHAAITASESPQIKSNSCVELENPERF